MIDPNDTSTRTPISRRRQRVHPKLRGAIELIVTVAIAAGLAFLVQALVVKPYRIPSASMEPTLAIQQRILVNRLDTKPGLYDVVVFHPPSGADDPNGRCGSPSQGITDGTQAMAQPCDTDLGGESDQTFVKRVVGLPGDTLRISDGHVYRNGQLEKDSFISPCAVGIPECDFAESIKVPEGDYYMMGDNRGNSDDSRYWGPVPRHDIIGVAFFTYWPIDRIGTL